MSESSTRDLSGWALLLDELKEREGITSDAKLAASLGCSRGYICSVRKGRKKLSLDIVSGILARLGRTFDTEALERLFVPPKVQVRSNRLAAVREFVINRANGRCQLCGEPAPFQDSRGKPYLEVHHVVPVSHGGLDTPANLVALCPNCQRKMEINASYTDRRRLQKLLEKYASPSEQS